MAAPFTASADVRTSAAIVAGTAVPGATIRLREDSSNDLLSAACSASGVKTVLRVLNDLIPERLGRALLASLRIEPTTTLSQLKRDDRRALAHALVRTPLPITGDRGYTFAEVTAGGIPLSEIHLDTMESRLCPGLHLCGEICDVDGRIGGFNFQWAWSSGYLAGRSAGESIAATHTP